MPKAKKKKKKSKESRLAFRKPMLKRMQKFLIDYGEAEGINTKSELARRAVDEFLKKYGV